MIGQTLAHYRIEAKLGEGGMGVVYKARDTHLDRPVAIKVLPHDKVADAGRKQRFAQEAKAASALNHPNIITIHDIRSQDGVDFIVMEYVEGQTLDELISPKGMRLVQALKYAVQIADALAKAHGARSEEHTSELQSRLHLVCRLLLEKKKKDEAQCHPNPRHNGSDDTRQ